MAVRRLGHETRPCIIDHHASISQLLNLQLLGSQSIEQLIK
jgi:hypothetical protein